MPWKPNSSWSFGKSCRSESVAAYPLLLCPYSIHSAGVKLGWDGTGRGGGPSLDGYVLNNLLLLFDGPPDARILLDDFEVRE